MGNTLKTCANISVTNYPFFLKGEMGKKLGNYSKQARNGNALKKNLCWHIWDGLPIFAQGRNG
jgi:hypothetical protein